MGPFVDSNHQVVKSGIIPYIDTRGEQVFLDYEEFFEIMITRLDNKIGSDTKVFIYPSVTDAFHPYPFPQPSFNKVKVDSQVMRIIFIHFRLLLSTIPNN